MSDLETHARPPRPMRLAAATTAKIQSLADLFSTQRLGEATRMTMGVNLVQSGITVITGITVARLLGTEGRGELAIIQSWAPFLSTVSLLGLHEATTYHVGRRPEQARPYWLGATALGLLTALPLTGLGCLLLPLLLSFQSPGLVRYTQLYAVGLTVAFVLHWMLLATLRGLRNYRLWNLLRLLPTLCWLGVVLGAAVLGVAQAGAVALGYVVLVSASFLPVAPQIVRRLPGAFTLDPLRWRPMLGYGIPLALASLPQWLWSSRIPQLLMATLLDPTHLGLFAVAVSWGSFAAPLLLAVGLVVFPEVAAARDEKEKVEILRRAVRLSILLAVVVCVPMLLLTPYALPLFFGRAFAPAVPAAMILTVGGGLMGVKGVLDHGLRGLGRPGSLLKAEIVGLVATGVTLALLLRPLGIVGAAVSSVAGFTATTIALLSAVKTAFQKGRPTVEAPGSEKEE